MMLSKDLFGYLSILLTFAANIPYCYLTWRGKIKPHAFTWIIWAAIGLIAGTAQTAGDAGPGAWANWTGAASGLLVAIFALFKGERNITRGDVIVFVGALAAIPAWQITQNPLAAIIILTCIDTAAYYPTIRKSWLRPREEPIFMYLNGNIIYALSLLANQVYSWTTVLLAVASIIMNFCVVAMILWRRRALGPSR